MYEEGKNYIVCLPFGWVFIGRFVKRLDYANNLFEGGSYIRNAGQTWAELIDRGPNNNTVIASIGTQSITNQTLWAAEWPHALPGG